jgi:catechol 2,3-dioxygenase-like lactoylglutathione lyase family enzyme
MSMAARTWIKFVAVGAVLAALPIGVAAQTPPAEEVVQISGPVFMVTDLERSLKFYTEGLGMIVASRLSGNPGPGAVVVGPERRPMPFILLRQRSREAVASPPIEIGKGLSRIMLNVPDAVAAAAKLKAAGFEVPPPNERGIFFVADPDGYRYEVMQAPPRH